MLIAIVILISVSILFLIKNKKEYSALTFGLASLLMLVLIVNGLSDGIHNKKIGDSTLENLNALILDYNKELEGSITQEKRKEILSALKELNYQYNTREKFLLQRLKEGSE